MKRKTIIAIVVAAVIIGGISYGAAHKSKQGLAVVKTQQVSQGEVKSYLSSTATIKSKNSKDYYAVTGKVKKVNIKIGDEVKKGQVLVEFDVTDPNIAVKQAQLNYDNMVLTKEIQLNSNNDVKNSIADLDRQIADLNSQITELKKSPQGAVEAAQLETQKAALQSKRDALKIPYSSEQLKQTDNNIALQKLNLDNAKANASKNQSNITAEFDGVVTALNVVEGAAVTMSAQPAVTVSDISDLKAVMAVGKYDAAKIQLGQPAVIKDGKKEYQGKVSFIDPAAKKSPSASGTETTLGVEIDIVDKPEGLKIDFDTDVDVLLGQVENVVKIPAESIRSNKEEKNYVFVVENSKVVEKEVKLGLQSDMEAQVIEGVNPGDKVILNPNSNMKSGDLIKEGTGK